MRWFVFTLLFGVFIAFCVGPFLWQALTSLKPGPEVFELGLPSQLTLESYYRVFDGRPFGRVMINSFVVASATTLLCAVIGSSAAFALSKLEFKGRKLLLGLALATSMFPAIATVSPLFLIIRELGLRDNLLALILTYTTFALPLTLWVLTGFFRDIPHGIYEAAHVDGCSPFQAFRLVFLPLAAPGIATTSILVFIFSYNEFLYALTFTSSPEQRTIPVAISLFASEHTEPWGEISAASVIAVLPLLVMTLLFQRRIVSGLTGGALKG